jgi:hypothetical protein
MLEAADAYGRTPMKWKAGALAFLTRYGEQGDFLSHIATGVARNS